MRSLGVLRDQTSTYQNITVDNSLSFSLPYHQRQATSQLGNSSRAFFLPEGVPTHALQAQATVQPPRLPASHQRSVLHRACERGCEHLRTLSTRSGNQQTLRTLLAQGAQGVPGRASVVRTVPTRGTTYTSDRGPPHQGRSIWRCG